eukprot:TRINITY_DN480_c0_g1_i6.p1 TRINITY_DN480_c0_g1~~TRINITY_DN480_c0_g1_i6.p1  ORF type:complete len:121 (+),score=13.77 TRINITY_DN480_c0_g1_i6:530-892(+)
MDESQCQNFWATNSEFWFIPVPFVGSEKREAKIGVLERSQKSALVIVRRGWWGWLADTWEGETVARRWPHAMSAFHGNQRRLMDTAGTNQHFKISLTQLVTGMRAQQCNLQFGKNGTENS